MPCHCTGNAQVARNVQITEKRKSMQGIFHSFPFVSSCAFSKAAYLVCTCQTRNRCLFAFILDSLEFLSWDDGFGLIPIVVWCRKCAVTKYHARFPVGLTFISVYLEDDFWVPPPVSSSWSVSCWHSFRIAVTFACLAFGAHAPYSRIQYSRGGRPSSGVALVGGGGGGGGRGDHKRRIFSGWLVGLDVCLPRSRRQGRVRFRCSCVTQINVLTDITHRSSRAPVNFLPN